MTAVAVVGLVVGSGLVGLWWVLGYLERGRRTEDLVWKLAEQLDEGAKAAIVDVQADLTSLINTKVERLEAKIGPSAEDTAALMEAHARLRTDFEGLKRTVESDRTKAALR